MEIKASSLSTLKGQDIWQTLTSSNDLHKHIIVIIHAGSIQALLFFSSVCIIHYTKWRALFQHGRHASILDVSCRACSCFSCYKDTRVQQALLIHIHPWSQTKTCKHERVHTYSCTTENICNIFIISYCSLSSVVHYCTIISSGTTENRNSTWSCN